MRIEPKLPPPTVERTATEPTAAPPAELKESEAAVVTLSSAGAAAQAGAADPTMRARLDHLRMQVERGEYKIDLDQLAARIVDDEFARSQGDR